jgi:ERCC4-type nuclease
VLAERGGTQLKTPRPVILLDTREQNPFDFSRFEGWFSGIEKKPLKLGDYSVAGLEDVCVVERKDLPDLIRSLTADRSVFVDRLRRMSRYPHRLLVITAALRQVKSPYPHGGVNPNRITQLLIAVLAYATAPATHGKHAALPTLDAPAALPALSLRVCPCCTPPAGAST